MVTAVLLPKILPTQNHTRSRIWVNICRNGKHRRTAESAVLSARWANRLCRFVQDTTAAGQSDG